MLPKSHIGEHGTTNALLASTALDGKIYVGGGLSWLGTTAAFEVFDPKTKTWHKLAPLPQPHHHLAMATANGRIYVTGGYSLKPRKSNLGLFACETNPGTSKKSND